MGLFPVGRPVGQVDHEAHFALERSLQSKPWQRGVAHGLLSAFQARGGGEMDTKNKGKPLENHGKTMVKLVKTMVKLVKTMVKHHGKMVFPSDLFLEFFFPTWASGLGFGAFLGLHVVLGVLIGG